MTAAGYTLPVWVAAAARAALQCLRADAVELRQPLWLEPDQARLTPVPVEAAALLGADRALAMARCDPGEGLDLTRGLLVWVEASWQPDASLTSWLVLEPGEGAGVQAATGELCCSAYARQLLERNLRPLVPPDRGLRLRLVLPAGRELARRTSNAAFGVVDGLALIGTQALVQRSAAPDQLAQARAALTQRIAAPDFAGELVLVIGENGLDLAPRLGVPERLLLKAGNWLGPLLVAAAEQGVQQLLLFGYQGKLIKLAGGIFHTHHHLADGRLEVLTALAAVEGLPAAQLQALYGAAGVDAALTQLAAADAEAASRLQARVAAAVEERSARYLQRHGQTAMAVGAVLFDRQRCICGQGPLGAEALRRLQARDLG